MTAAASAADEPEVRPTIASNRWQEDWSVLANPAVPAEPLDPLKYLPLGSDPLAYLSFGVNMRERVESNDAPSFGTGSNQRDAYLIQRLLVHADLHLGADWRAFVQLEDERAFWKRTITMVDANQLDLRLAFLEYVRASQLGTIKIRAGRQDFAFDLQRFVSSRDGPNVRQSYDAVWADWELQPWRVLGFVSQPVQYRDGQPFDDYSTPRMRFSTLRLERHIGGTNELSLYWGLYQRDRARFLDAAGRENRHVVDARLSGLWSGFDWDVEAMGQVGSIGGTRIAAWAFGSRTGYTLTHVAWKPRIGLQIDAASGDDRPGDGRIRTFNPLFPNGYYFSLAGYSSYVNIMHIKPMVTLHPATRLAVTAALGLQWRMTTADAIYVQPNIPVARTIGVGSAWTGYYGQFRADYAITPKLATAVEAVDFASGHTIKAAGGRDSQYLGVELRAGW